MRYLQPRWLRDAMLAGLLVIGGAYESHIMDSAGVVSSVRAADGLACVPPLQSLVLQGAVANTAAGAVEGSFTEGQARADVRDQVGMDGGGYQGSPAAPTVGCWPFPDAECDTLQRIAECESGGGTNPAAYNVEAENGGKYQLNRGTWAGYFEREYGWPWSLVVMDDTVNQQAAYIIWQRSGWGAWACY